MHTTNLPKEGIFFEIMPFTHRIIRHWSYIHKWLRIERFEHKNNIQKYIYAALCSVIYTSILFYIHKGKQAACIEKSNWPHLTSYRRHFHFCCAWYTYTQYTTSVNKTTRLVVMCMCICVKHTHIRWAVDVELGLGNNFIGVCCSIWLALE